MSTKWAPWGGTTVAGLVKMKLKTTLENTRTVRYQGNGHLELQGRPRGEKYIKIDNIKGTIRRQDE